DVRLAGAGVNHLDTEALGVALVAVGHLVLAADRVVVRALAGLGTFVPTLSGIRDGHALALGPARVPVRLAVHTADGILHGRTDAVGIRRAAGLDRAHVVVRARGSRERQRTECNQQPEEES